MKGVIFTFLADMVEEQFGLETWDAILTETGLNGVYVSTETYPDAEVFKLVEATHNATGIPASELIKAFGQYAFSKFQKSHPSFCKAEYTLKEFLLTVDSVIHVEVKKLQPEASLPSFEYKDQAENELTMLYSSPRKLCMLAEGLIAGAANFYKTQYTLTHGKCMHNGDDHCEMHIKMHDA